MIKLKDIPRGIRPPLYKVNDSYRTAQLTITSGDVLGNERNNGYICIDGIVEKDTMILIPNKEIMTVRKVNGCKVLVHREKPSKDLKRFDIGYCIGYKGELTYTSTFPKNFRP
jgi:hypothetical protein